MLPNRVWFSGSCINFTFQHFEQHVSELENLEQVVNVVSAQSVCVVPIILMSLLICQSYFFNSPKSR